MILIRTEREKYDIVDFSKVSTKSLASGSSLVLSSQMNKVRANLEVNVDSGHDLVFFWCENGTNLVPADRVTLHAGTCIRRV